jgi:hypothetical protein
MLADNRDSCAAQLLGNGGKIEPYTIILMEGPFQFFSGGSKKSPKVGVFLVGHKAH